MRGIKAKISFDSSNILNIVLFIVNSLTYQSYITVAMLTIYSIHLRLNAITNFLKTLQKNESYRGRKFVLEKIKIAAILVDKSCDILEAVKVCYSVNNIYYILH